MFSMLKNRFGIPGILAALALVFAMVGGAWAANKFIITSTKQIKPSVLAQLKGQSGPPGAQGPAGPQGPAGANGKEGAAGAKGATGATGATGAAGTNGTNGATGATGATGAAGTNGTNGATGATGATGSPWTAGGTLPSKATETGSWAVTTGAVTAESALGYGAAPFALPLAAELDLEHTIVVSEGGEGELGKCSNAAATEKGKASHPLAAPGFLCVYIGSGFAAAEGTATFIRNASAAGFGASTAGAVVQVNAKKAPRGIYGTYAVTAP
jgi:collagen type I alpha